jgi:hypothetical protein
VGNGKRGRFIFVSLRRDTGLGSSNQLSVISFPWQWAAARFFGGWASLRGLAESASVKSMLACFTNKLLFPHAWLNFSPVARVAQLDRASASGAEGCGFNPRLAYQSSLEMQLERDCRAGPRQTKEGLSTHSDTTSSCDPASQGRAVLF